MLATRTPSPKSHPLPLGLVPRTNFDSPRRNRLERADFSRDARLLDASVAGIVLNFNPRDEEMREKAERAWKTIRGLLSDDLFADGDPLPWTGAADRGCRKSSLPTRGQARRFDGWNGTTAGYCAARMRVLLGGGDALVRMTGGRREG
jgi:hypothetical protein